MHHPWHWTWCRCSETTVYRIRGPNIGYLAETSLITCPKWNSIPMWQGPLASVVLVPNSCSRHHLICSKIFRTCKQTFDHAIFVNFLHLTSFNFSCDALRLPEECPGGSGPMIRTIVNSPSLCLNHQLLLSAGSVILDIFGQYVLVFDMIFGDYDRGIEIFFQSWYRLL